MWLRASQRTQPVVRGAANQRLEPEANRLGVRLRGRNRPGFAQKVLVNVQGLFHTYNYAISVWHDGPHVAEIVRPETIIAWTHCLKEPLIAQRGPENRVGEIHSPANVRQDDRKTKDVTSGKRARLPIGFAHHLPTDEKALQTFHQELKLRLGDAPRGASPAISSPAVRELAALIEANAIVRMYVEQMLVQARALPGAPDSTIDSVGELLAALDAITRLAPLYNADPKRRNAFPMSALFAYMMMTVAGEALFRNRAFNDAIQKVLKEWCSYLDGNASAHVLNETPTGWLCPAAVKEFSLNDFVIDRAKPHWGFTSYNDFFHRQIKAEARRISAPADPKVVVSANDGNVVSIARDVRRTDRFWLKG